ncbi:hypothetical protein [Nocardioides jensenii]|uniref:hypothetical protein n=1 Tax=Nocardioides jensenii TaxID=1843 RepID=UPI00083535FA|nr:hypothetical protein [Nocardioides jensenii]
MKFTVENGLWACGAPVDPPPLVAVLEVSGAILEWTVDEPEPAPRITLTDVDAADWLWRVVGEDAHVRLVEAVAGAAGSVDVPIDAGALSPLRRLALGHWMRRWWPASARDGISALTTAVLDAELALLSVAVEEFLDQEAFDAELEALVRGLADLPAPLRADPRVADLVTACSELPVAVPEPGTGARWRADYALVAGSESRAAPGVIAAGTASVSWASVPPGVFDAGEDTLTWSVVTSAEPNGSPARVIGRVQTVLADPTAPHPLAAGIAVQLRSGALAAVGELDAEGAAGLSLDLAESAAWDHDWATTEVQVGVGSGESRAVRERVRRFVRSRLAAPPEDAFLAELLAAEDDY